MPLSELVALCALLLKCRRAKNAVRPERADILTSLKGG
jgi:hypothetical protein